MKNKKIILIAVFAVAAALIYFLSRGSKEEQPSMGENSAAPQLEISDVMTNQKIASSSLQGKVVFINIWASWCEPCREEMPSIDALYREMSASQDFRMLTILYRDSPPTALEYMKSQGFVFPVYIDPDGLSARKYGVTGVPETFIVDKKGMLVKRVIGGMDWNSQEVKDYLHLLLKP